MDWFALLNSMRISLLSSLITLALGIWSGWCVTKLSPKVKGVVDAILTIPMVLPPTVIGFVLLMVLAPRGIVGQWVWAWFGRTITMQWYAAVFAVVVVTYPILYRTVRSSLESLDPHLVQVGQTLGLSNRRIFWKIILPNCKVGILAGFVLAFARGLGEYGATSMVAGFIQGSTATISTTVAYYWQTNQSEEALFWVGINLVISFVAMMALTLLERPYTKGGRRVDSL